MIGEAVELLHANHLRQVRIANEKERRSEVKQSNEPWKMIDLRNTSQYLILHILFIGKCVVPTLNVLRQWKSLQHQILAGPKKYLWLSKRDVSVFKIWKILLQPLLKQKSDNDKKTQNYPQHDFSSALPKLFRVSFSPLVFVKNFTRINFFSLSDKSWVRTDASFSLEILSRHDHKLVISQTPAILRVRNFWYHDHVGQCWKWSKSKIFFRRITE